MAHLIFVCVQRRLKNVTVSIKWLGHASFQVRAEDKVIYVDLKKYGKVVETSEKADLILVTHGHGDHCSPPKIQKVRRKDTVVIAPKNCASNIGGIVKSLGPGEEAILGNIRVRAVEAYNYKRFKPSGKPWHPKGYGVGYLITVGDKTIYHAGDTDFIQEMKQLGPIDVALLPTGDKYTMDNAEAAEAAFAVNPKVVVPIHRWDTDPGEFKKRVEAGSKIKVMVLREGEECVLA
jgi:L-ascorbate metabolism protein UlaG (beta-lactamase superfamily)